MAPKFTPFMPSSAFKYWVYGVLFWAPPTCFTFSRSNPLSPVNTAFRGFFIPPSTTQNFTQFRIYPILSTPYSPHTGPQIMATFEKRGRSWRVQVKRGDFRKSETFPTKAEAQAWATRLEAEIIAGKRGAVPNKTFGELLQKYHDEISPTKKGARPEQIRIKRFMKDPIAEVKLADLTAVHFAGWRNRRLASVEPGTVLREWNTMSNACKVARYEWHWMKDSPLKEVAKPKKPAPRKRRPSDEETKMILHSTGYRKDVLLKTATSRTGAAYLFAMESALRIGEICALRESEIYFDKKYLKVTGLEHGARKNNAAVRDVPLTDEAIRILRQLLVTTTGKKFVFDLTTANADALFRKAKKRMGIENLDFHDTRHEAITRLARIYEVLDLAILVGHTNLEELKTYYNPTIEEIVDRMRTKKEAGG